VTFTTVLTIYLSWIHPLHLSPLFSLLPLLEYFNRSHFPFHAWVQSISTTFTLLHPVLMTFTRANPQTGAVLPTCSLFLKEKYIFICLRWLYREFHCDISMYICIITWIGSSPLFFPFLPQSLSYGDFHWFKNINPHSNSINISWELFLKCKFSGSTSDLNQKL
jgi:hypothetical protein